MKVLKIAIFVLLSFFANLVFAQKETALVGKDEKTVKLFFEKAYLQTDRAYYNSGEDIWFSAYLVNGKSASLTSTSNNLYVELISPNSKIIERKIIRIDEGLGKGDFKLKDTLQSGWYQIRAYTNWMRNFGNDFVFQKKIYITKTTFVAETNSTKNVNQKAQNAVVIPQSKKTITFFPEGGNLVEGITSIVAFKTDDEFGNGLKTMGSIISSKGDTITTFQSTEMGMGIFAFTPLVNEKYKVEGFYNDEKFITALPTVLKNGFAMHLTTDSANIKVAISTNELSFNELQGKPVSIVIKHAGDNVYTGTLAFNKPTVSVTIPTKGLPAGLAVLTLIDHLGRPNCERLVYIQSAAKISFEVTPDKMSYTAKEKVNLQIKATDFLGQPVKTNLSIAVVDGLIPNDANNIVSYLMLQSEIKGDIKNAAQYFDPQNKGRFKQLDLLLLTQGWRDYLWRKLADSNLSVSYLPEPGITIRGTVREKIADKPMPNMNITLFGSNLVGNKIYTTKTDAAGRYFLDGLNWYGNQAIKISSQDNSAKKGGWLLIDSVFKPLPISFKKLIPFEIPSGLKAEMENRINYNRKYKVGDSIMLDEVTIVQQKNKKLQLFDETLTTFGYEDQVFNITAADYDYKGLEHYLLTNAKGAQTVDDMDSVSNEGVTFLANGKKIRPRILINNKEDIQDRLDYYSLTMDQINQIVVKHLVGSTGNDVYVINLNLKDSALRGPNLNLLNINLNGYYTAKSFYSPNFAINPTTNKDLRTTIFWAPLLKTNDKGILNISFYNSDNKGNVSINADGITEKGVAVAVKTTYKIQ